VLLASNDAMFAVGLSEGFFGKLLFTSNFFHRYFFIFTQVTFSESTLKSRKYVKVKCKKSRLTITFTQVSMCSTLNKSAGLQLTSKQTAPLL